MNPMDIYAGQLTWARDNINNNLDFIPDDKLGWKPAPDAKSALEIIEHMTNTIAFFSSMLPGASPKREFPAPKNRDEAKALVSQSIEAHLALIHTLSPQQLQETVSLPFGQFSAAQFAGFPVIESINHHGQLTYIQELLGDTESHLVFG